MIWIWIFIIFQSTDWCHIRIDEMTPSMLDVGNTLDDSMKLQRLHLDMVQKLQVKNFRPNFFFFFETKAKKNCPSNFKNHSKNHSCPSLKISNSNLKAKQSNIEELLAKADDLVAQQPKPEADVYEAMADSLGNAWKELNRQLQLRTILLDQAVQFFSWVEKVKNFHYS